MYYGAPLVWTIFLGFDYVSLSYAKYSIFSYHLSWGNPPKHGILFIHIRSFVLETGVYGLYIRTEGVVNISNPMPSRELFS
jgi:hypothetical protein